MFLSSFFPFLFFSDWDCHGSASWCPLAWSQSRIQTGTIQIPCSKPGELPSFTHFKMSCSLLGLEKKERFRQHCPWHQLCNPAKSARPKRNVEILCENKRWQPGTLWGFLSLALLNSLHKSKTNLPVSPQSPVGNCVCTIFKFPCSQAVSSFDLLFFCLFF